VIKKAPRETVFGHKVFFATGKSNLITDCMIVRGNPFDSGMFSELLDRSSEILGCVPMETSADGGFASNDNEQYARSIGVKTAFFTKTRSIVIKQRKISDYTRKKLKCFRAGIEACISNIKRLFGLSRCNWSGFESFCSYVWMGVIGFNLKVLANYLIC